jgi:hypothetical protein
LEEAGERQTTLKCQYIYRTHAARHTTTSVDMSRNLIDTALIDDGTVPTYSDLQLRPLNVERGNTSVSA